MKKLGLFIFAIIFISYSYAQERKYERKSITSLGSVLYLKVNPPSDLTGIIANRFKAHIEIPRFDYNQISDDAVREFVKKANETDLSPQSIAKALDETIVPKIVEVVEFYAEERAKGNLKEEQLITAAVEKMKGSGLTADDIIKVLNSAYIYLPVVTFYEETTTGNIITAHIKGFMIWYQIRRNQQGKYNARLMTKSNEIFTGISSATKDDKYSLKNRKVDGTTYARLMAVNTWAKNLAVEMKKIPEFMLSGEIKNVEGSYVEATLGTKEGLIIDEGYDIVEFEEDSYGNLKKVNAGFVRASVIADTRNNPNAVSKFKKYIGKNIERGMLLAERPRLGIDLFLRAKRFDANLPLDDWSGIFEEDIKGGIGFDIGLQLNLAKYIKASQTFLYVDFGYGLLNAKANETFIDELSSASVISIYGGLTKKFWVSRINLELGAGYGFNMIDIMYKNLSNEEYEVSAGLLGFRADANLSYLANPDLTIGLHLAYKSTSDIDEVTIKKDGKEISGSPFSVTTKSNLTGLSIGLNFTYALPSLFFDPFEAITSKEIEY
jgi:hypothetical protein